MAEGYADVIWSGWEELIEEFSGIAENVPARVDRIMSGIGEEAKNVMDAYTPVGIRATKDHKPGTLKAGNKMQPIEHGFTLENKVEYAPFVEYGTTKMHAQPYLEPAREWARKAMDDRLPEAFE